MKNIDGIALSQLERLPREGDKIQWAEPGIYLGDREPRKETLTIIEVEITEITIDSDPVLQTHGHNLERYDRGEIIDRYVEVTVEDSDGERQSIASFESAVID